MTSIINLYKAVVVRTTLIAERSYHYVFGVADCDMISTNMENIRHLISATVDKLDRCDLSDDFNKLLDPNVGIWRVIMNINFCNPSIVSNFKLDYMIYELLSKIASDKRYNYVLINHLKDENPDIESIYQAAFLRANYKHFYSNGDVSIYMHDRDIKVIAV